MTNAALNLFYKEPFDDQWLPYDRYPRRAVRWLLHRDRPSGHRHVTHQLRLGLKRAGIRCRVNAFRHAERDPDQPLGILGKNVLLDHWQPPNPSVFGPCMLDHPKDRIDLFEKLNAQFYLVPSSWMRDMFAPYFGDRVLVWPIGIDLECWPDFSCEEKRVDFLVYEKFLWDKPKKLQTVLRPILAELDAHGFSHSVLHCGHYTNEEYRRHLREARRMIFLCEHETQGQAYQQALACNVPVFAWDQGWWLDPKARLYEARPVPASSVPYFSDVCGMKFRRLEEFNQQVPAFLESRFLPRSFVAEHLDLVQSARRYSEIAQSAACV